MEKISGIVRGSPRVTSTDTTKTASAARTGMPSFGRPQAEVAAADPKTSSTASRAVALFNANNEAKKAMTQERVAQQIADKFFMTHGPEMEVQNALPLPDSIKTDSSSTEDLVMADVEPGSVEAPVKSSYTPKGSFVNVHA